MLAEWAGDDHLRRAIHALPDVLDKAIHTRLVTLSTPPLYLRNSIFCLGRGPAYAMSNEAALKFKETCQIHAESYSSAEVLHGPVSIVDGGFPVIAFASQDHGGGAFSRGRRCTGRQGGDGFRHIANGSKGHCFAGCAGRAIR